MTYTVKANRIVLDSVDTIERARELMRAHNDKVKHKVSKLAHIVYNEPNLAQVHQILETEMDSDARHLVEVYLKHGQIDMDDEVQIIAQTKDLDKYEVQQLHDTAMRLINQ